MKTGRVYKIIAVEGNEVYVGSTFNTTRDRFKMHKGAYGQGKPCSINILFDKYGVDNCKMILIKEYEVIDRRHLEVYETLWIQKLKAINKVEPCAGILERERKKQYQKRYGKQYYQENKQKINEKHRHHHHKNKEKLNGKKKQYYQENKEKINEKHRQNYQQIKEKRLEKINCECGAIISKINFKKHQNTKKHNENMKLIC